MKINKAADLVVNVSPFDQHLQLGVFATDKYLILLLYLFIHSLDFCLHITRFKVAEVDLGWFTIEAGMVTMDHSRLIYA